MGNNPYNLHNFVLADIQNLYCCFQIYAYSLVLSNQS